VLDDYFERFDTRRAHEGPGMNGRKTIGAFTEGVPKNRQDGGDRPDKKLPNSKAVEAHFKCDQCHGNTVIIQILGAYRSKRLNRVMFLTREEKCRKS
jgi:hypothetical protein